MSVIRLRDILSGIDPSECKLHCAKYNGQTQPIDALTGSAAEWESWNRYRGARDDFNRRFIVSLARDRQDASLWLFGGVFEVVGRRDEPHTLSYDVTYRDDLMGAYAKRLWLHFTPPGRATRLNMETHLDAITVVAIEKVAYSGVEFPGIKNIRHSIGTLEAAVKYSWSNWESALKSPRGVYVIVDKSTGKAYVGAAYGQDGFWGRLRQYVQGSHGNNVGLKDLVDRYGHEYAQSNFVFSLLEVMSSEATDEDVLTRESYWKSVLMTQKFGLNGATPLDMDASE